MGLSTAVSHMARNLNNMGRIAQGVGIVDAVDQDLMGCQMGRAIRRCLFCRQTGPCSAWISAQDGAITESPAFCPNRGYFQHLKQIAEQARPA